MKKAKFCLMALALSASVATYADDVESLVFYGANGSALNTVELSTIQKLTFGDNGFTVVRTGADNLELEYAKVASIKFKDLTNGIQAVSNGAGAQQLALHFDGQSVWADGAEGMQGAVYSVNGQRLIGTRMDGQKISVENLPNGVYVFKAGGKSIKFAK